MPCIDGDKVYICHGSRYACLSMQDGRLLWEKGFSTPGHAPGHPAYVWKDFAILTHFVMPEKGNRVELAAVKKDTGELVWSYEEPRHVLSAGYSVPLCAKVNGQEMLLHNSGGFACGLEPLTGRQIWELVPSPKLAGEHGTTLSPLTDGSSVLTFAARDKGDGLITSLHIDNGEAKEAWVTDFGCTWSPPLIQNGLLFAFTPGAWGNPDNKSTFRCVDMKTGKDLWIEKNVSAGHIVGVDGKLLVLTFEGNLWLVEPSGEKFNKVAEWKGAIKPVPWWTGNGGKGPCPCWTMPTIARGKIYLRSSDHLACYDLMSN
jgi:outer membrane protein assembly factor BamB